MWIMCGGMCTFLCYLFPAYAFQAIEGMLRDQKGILSIKVALLAERAVVEFEPEHWTVEKIINVSRIGLCLFLVLTLHRKYRTSDSTQR